MQKLHLTVVLIFLAFHMTGQNNDSIQEKITVINLDCKVKTTPNPLYIIQIKDKEFMKFFEDEGSKEKFIGELNPEWIGSVNVLRGPEGVEKYGSRAKEGVVIWILKEDSWSELPQNFRKLFK